MPNEPKKPDEPELAHAVANGGTLLETGEALLAFEALSDSLERWPDSLRLRQLRGLALARLECGCRNGCCRESKAIVQTFEREDRRNRCRDHGHWTGHGPERTEAQCLPESGIVDH